MKAITVEPKKLGSVRYEDFPEPDLREGSILVEAIAAAVCGTDVDSEHLRRYAVAFDVHGQVK